MHLNRSERKPSGKLMSQMSTSGFSFLDVLSNSCKGGILGCFSEHCQEWPPRRMAFQEAAKLLLLQAMGWLLFQGSVSFFRPLEWWKGCLCFPALSTTHNLATWQWRLRQSAVPSRVLLYTEWGDQPQGGGRSRSLLAGSTRPSAAAERAGE